YYYPGWQEPGPALELLINRKVLESLPADLRTMIEVAARAVNQDVLDQYMARNNAALQQLIDGGVQVRRLPDDVLRALKRASEAVVADIVGSDPMAAKVYRSWKAFFDEVKEPTRISEQAFLDARDL